METVTINKKIKKGKRKTRPNKTNSWHYIRNVQQGKE